MLIKRFPRYFVQKVVTECTKNDIKNFTGYVYLTLSIHNRIQINVQEIEYKSKLNCSRFLCQKITKKENNFRSIILYNSKIFNIEYNFFQIENKLIKLVKYYPRVTYDKSTSFLLSIEGLLQIDYNNKWFYVLFISLNQHSIKVSWNKRQLTNIFIKYAFKFSGIFFYS